MNAHTRAPRPSRGWRRSRSTLVATVVLAAGASAGILALASSHHSDLGESPADQRAAVHRHGTMVMPFDLSKTTHVFRKTTTGGVESVIAKLPNDVAQIDLVRGHLRKEAQRFAVGDFSDPIAAHGANMPGVKALSAGAARIHFSYSDLPAGGRLTYATSSPPLVSALHSWFSAQLRDHGSDATP